MKAVVDRQVIESAAACGEFGMKAPVVSDNRRARNDLLGLTLNLR